MAALVPIVAEAEHSVAEAYDSGEVLQLVIRSQFDIVMIPDGAEPIDGQEVLPLIRRLTLGAIIVVGDGDETAIANALLQGADQYLRFPVDSAILRSRLRSLLRPRRHDLPKRSSTQGETRESRELQRLLDDETHRFVSEPLSPTEERLLRRLIDQRGAPIQADHLASEVWGRDDKAASLRFYIRKLRRKLEPSGMFRILAQKGVGYRLEWSTGK